MSNSRLAIAILEDDAGRTAAMRAWLAERLGMYDMHFSTSADEMIEWLGANLDRLLLVSLDHDLEPANQADGRKNPGTGLYVAEYLSMKSPRCPIILHSTNAAAVVKMREVLEDSHWSVSRIMPYDDLLWISEAWWPLVMERILEHGMIAAQGLLAE